MHDLDCLCDLSGSKTYVLYVLVMEIEALPTLVIVRFDNLAIEFICSKTPNTSTPVYTISQLMQQLHQLTKHTSCLNHIIFHILPRGCQAWPLLPYSTKLQMV